MKGRFGDFGGQYTPLKLWNKIENAFVGKKVFIPFIVCGYPDLETAKKCIFAMIEAWE